MKARTGITLITWLIAAAVTGLIAVQLYWIDNSISLRREEFREDVNTALNRAINGMERDKTVDYIRSHSLGSRLFEQLSRHSGTEHSQIVQRTTTRDTIIQKDGQKIQMQVVEKEKSDTSTGLRAQERFFSRIVQNEYNENTGEASINIYLDDSISLSFKPTMFSEEISRGQKALMLDEILSDMFAFRGYEPLEKRVNIKRLDSLLAAELANRNIKAEYQFVIAGLDRKALLFKNDSSQENALQILDEGYSINLFPGDFLNEPAFLFVYFPHQDSYLLGKMWSVLSVSAVLILIIIGAFYYTLLTIFRQKKLSSIKNDFISNMTHELKTPISTIGLATEVLSDEEISISDTQRSNYIRMIREENKRLGILVESVLQSAVIERGELKVKTEALELHELLHDLVQNFEIQVQQRGGILQYLPSSQEAWIMGDRVHLTNVFYNLLDNANKYSPDMPEIKVQTRVLNHSVQVLVSDKGMGISRENQRKIFERLYRVPSGNIHNVKGFGLGLSYVKAIVEKHGGTVEVDSESGRGSTFILEIPLHHDPEN